MHSTTIMLPEQEQAVQTLLTLGTNHSERDVISLLVRFKWDTDAAASALFSELPELPPHHEFLPPSPQVGPIHLDPAANSKPQSGVYENLSKPSKPNSVSSSNHGALNVPQLIVPSQPKGGYLDDDDELQRGIAISLGGTDAPPTSTELVLAAGPRNYNDTGPVLAMGYQGPIGFSQEEQALSRALEASLTTSMDADVYEEVPPEKSVRVPELPVALRTKRLTHIHLTLLLQALSVVPQVQEVFRIWRVQDEPSEELMSRPMSSEQLHDLELVKALQSLFAAMDLSERSHINIDGLMDMVGTGQLHPSSPGEDIKALYDEGIALKCDRLFHLYNESAVHVMPRVFLSKTGASDFDARSTTVNFGRNDLATLEVMSSTTPGEQNRLESALFKYMLQAPVPSFLIKRAPIIGVRVSRHDAGPASERKPLLFPARLYLDPYLWENSGYVREKLDDIERGTEDMDRMMKAADSFTAREDKDPISDLKQTIHYLENVANPKNDHTRAVHLKAMADYLRDILSSIEERLEGYSQTYAELQQRTVLTMTVPEMQRHSYDLRAVLVHEGLVGREHSYAYLKEPVSGKWFKSCDATVQEVPEATIFSDRNGLHHNAGPYFFLYSETTTGDPALRTHLPWPDQAVDNARKLNEDFRNLLPPDLVQGLVSKDQSNPPQAPRRSSGLHRTPAISLPLDLSSTLEHK